MKSSNSTAAPARALVVPFLFLNHQLDRERLTRFLGHVFSLGIDGIIPHAREGLLTPYLSEAWFDAIRLCVVEARKRRKLVWLYDEFPYPSGVAGGKVLEGRPDWQESHLVLERYPAEPQPDGNFLLGSGPALAVYGRNGTTWVDLSSRAGCLPRTWIRREWDSRWYYPKGMAERISCPRTGCYEPWLHLPITSGENWREFLVVRQEFGGSYVEPFGAYVDVSNRAATARFLELTHEAYFARFPRDFGKTIAGIFTDEPKFRNARPWGEGIRLRLGQGFNFSDLVQPEATLERQTYRKAVQESFLEAWTTPVAAWCRRKKIGLCGHISPEEDWWLESRLTGSILPHLRLMEQPGCDVIIPRPANRRNPVLYLTVAMAVSAAAQSGRSHALCEAFGASGHGLCPSVGSKILDWLAVSGINMVVPHGCFLSMGGMRRDDAPTTFCHPNPLAPAWARLFALFRANASRLGPGSGADVLILRPMASLRGLRDEDRPRSMRWMRECLAVIRMLLERGLSFHLADDDDVERLEALSMGFSLGSASYRLWWAPEPMKRSAGILRLPRLDPLNMPDGPMRRTQGVLARRGVRGWFLVNQSSRSKLVGIDGRTTNLSPYEGKWLEDVARKPVRSFQVAATTYPGPWEGKFASSNQFALLDWKLGGRRASPAAWFEHTPASSTQMVKTAFGPVASDRPLKRIQVQAWSHLVEVRESFPAHLIFEDGDIEGNWELLVNGEKLPSPPPDAGGRIVIDLSSHLLPGSNVIQLRVACLRTRDGLLASPRIEGGFSVLSKPRGGVLTKEPPVLLASPGDSWAHLGRPHYSGTLNLSARVAVPVDCRAFRISREESVGGAVLLRVPGERTERDLSISPWSATFVRRRAVGRTVDLHLSCTNTLASCLEAAATTGFGKFRMDWLV